MLLSQSKIDKFFNTLIQLLLMILNTSDSKLRHCDLVFIYLIGCCDALGWEQDNWIFLLASIGIKGSHMNTCLRECHCRHPITSIVVFIWRHLNL